MKLNNNCMYFIPKTYLDLIPDEIYLIIMRMVIKKDLEQLFARNVIGNYRTLGENGCKDSPYVSINARYIDIPWDILYYDQKMILYKSNGKPIYKIQKSHSYISNGRRYAWCYALGKTDAKNENFLNIEQWHPKSDKESLKNMVKFYGGKQSGTKIQLVQKLWKLVRENDEN